MDFLKNGIDFLRHEMLILQGELNVHAGLQAGLEFAPPAEQYLFERLTMRRAICINVFAFINDGTE